MKEIYMYDYHCHTYYSFDSKADINQMIEAGIGKGLREIALTDHYDPKYSKGDKDVFIDLERHYKDLDRAHRAYENEIKVVRGIELGLQKKSLTEIADAVRKYPYDFVLGSFHCAENMELCSPLYFEGRSLEAAYRGFYGYVYDCLQRFRDFDILGHLNIVERYSGAHPDPDCYMDLVEKILMMIVDYGKGIELNTSSYRYGMGERLTPSWNMLKLYRCLGGEVITVGSDAHRPQDVGFHLKESYDILKSAGFSKITVYENRMLRQMPLDFLG